MGIQMNSSAWIEDIDPERGPPILEKKFPVVWQLSKSILDYKCKAEVNLKSWLCGDLSLLQ
jgi:hypothetical protein